MTRGVTFVAAICLILLLSGTANASLLAASLMVLPALVALSYRPNESPVLLFFVVYQWLQISTKAIHAAVIGMDVRDMLPWAPVDEAIWLGLGALLALTAGLRFALQGMKYELGTAALEQAGRLRLFDLIKLHLILLIAVEVLARMASIGGLSQVVFAIGYLRFATLFIIGYAVVVQKRGYLVLLVVLAAEVAYSLGGFFASFRLPLFVTLLAVVSVPIARSFTRMILLVVLGVGTLYLGIVWQAVKGDYRDYVSEGTGDQVVLVDRDDQWRKLSELFGGVNEEMLDRGVEGLAVRFAYVDFFAFTLVHVPDTEPHTGGQLMLDSIAHVMMPRILFPDKPIIDDTVFTRKYTGLAMYSVQGTSISLGYVVETYIDFGVPGMFFANFAIGLFLGICYRFMVSYRVEIPVLRVALLTMLVLAAGDFSTPLPKVLGGFLVPFLVATVYVIFGEPRVARVFSKELGLVKKEPAS